jgi:glutamyl/glutaminyl-tRNA synthetase
LLSSIYNIFLHTNASTYRGRLAPSPTGYLHLGHARTFWTAYERVRSAAGTLIFRNEDLDPYRSRPEFESAMYEDLRWFGLHWQEGPDVGGPDAPYQQSLRRSFYLDAWRKLLRDGFIYPCSCSRKDLAQSAHAPHENAPGLAHAPDDEPIYPGTCRRKTSHATDPAGLNWRFRVPDGERILFDDAHFGPQKFVAGSDFGDFMVWRRDDVPAYQLAVVVDDAAMNISEVVRGADLLRSTARQLLLQRALHLTQLAYFHCPLITDAGGERLAKRHDALSLRSLRASGQTPEQIRATW